MKAYVPGEDPGIYFLSVVVKETAILQATQVSIQIKNAYH